MLTACCHAHAVSVPPLIAPVALASTALAEASGEHHVLAGSTDVDFVFKHAKYHVKISEVPIFSVRSVYVLTGHIGIEGGYVSAHHQNGSKTQWTSHKILFGKAFLPFPGRPSEIYRNISANIHGETFFGHAIFYQPTGKPMHCVELLYFRSAGHRAHIVLREGANPTPHPPQPTPDDCRSAFSESDCEAIGDHHICTWCKSSDHLHQLCFPAVNAPKDIKKWSCDEHAAAVMV